jgi:hypothetical protein
MTNAALDHLHTLGVNAANWLDTPIGHSAMISAAVMAGWACLKFGAWPATRWAGKRAWRVAFKPPKPKPEPAPVVRAILESLAGEADWHGNANGSGVLDTHALKVNVGVAGQIHSLTSDGLDAWIDLDAGQKAEVSQAVQGTIARVEARRKAQRLAAFVGKAEGGPACNHPSARIDPAFYRVDAKAKKVS